MPWTKNDLHPLFGSELSGLQINAALGRRDRNVLKSAVEESGVVVVRGQELADSDLREFASSLGSLYRAPGIFEKADGVYRISNVDEDGRILPADDTLLKFNISNEFWHTDSTYSRPRAMISFLYARTVPPAGGDTEFCDTRVAYETLSEQDKQGLDDLVGHHSLIYSRSLTGFDDWTDEQREIYAPVPRPLVQVHEGSGRKALCLASHICRLDPLPEDEGRTLLTHLMEHATGQGKVYTHRWSPGDLIMWDNRCTMHRARPYAYDRDVRDFRTARILDLADQ